MKAEEFIAIKERVKNEMNRRCLAGLDQGSSPINFGSLRKFGEAEYEFETVPEQGEAVLAEQGEKVINIMYEVKDIDSPFVAKGMPLKVNGLDEYLSQLEKEPIEGESSSCRGACSGLCFGSCINGCNGCSGACNTGCQGCSATCGSGCASGYRYA